MIQYSVYEVGGKKIGEIRRKKAFSTDRRGRCRWVKRIKVGKKTYKILRATRKEIALTFNDDPNIGGILLVTSAHKT